MPELCITPGGYITVSPTERDLNAMDSPGPELAIGTSVSALCTRGNTSAPVALASATSAPVTTDVGTLGHMYASYAEDALNLNVNQSVVVILSGTTVDAIISFAIAYLPYPAKLFAPFANEASYETFNGLFEENSDEYPSAFSKPLYKGSAHEG